jgi:exocyst complex component 4
MVEDRCVPIQVALKLSDSSSLGLATRHHEFEDTHQQLQRALKAIVNGRNYVPATVILVFIA